MTSLTMAVLFALAFMSTMDSRFAFDFVKSLVAIAFALVVASLVRSVAVLPKIPGDQQIGFALGFGLALAVLGRFRLGFPRLAPSLLALWFALEVLALRHLGRPASIHDYIDQRVGGYFAALVAIWPLVALVDHLGGRKVVTSGGLRGKQKISE